jgi:hypothetical protein
MEQSTYFELVGPHFLLLCIGGSEESGKALMKLFESHSIFGGWCAEYTVSETVSVNTMVRAFSKVSANVDEVSSHPRNPVIILLCTKVQLLVQL